MQGAGRHVFGGYRADQYAEYHGGGHTADSLPVDGAFFVLRVHAGEGGEYHDGEGCTDGEMLGVGVVADALQLQRPQDDGDNQCAAAYAEQSCNKARRASDGEQGEDDVPSPHFSDDLFGFTAFFQPTPYCHDVAGEAVTQEKQEKYKRRFPVDEQQYQHGKHHAHKRDLAADIDFFKAPKRDLDNHGNAGEKRDAQSPPMYAGEAFDAVVDPNQADNQRSGSRTGNTDEPSFIDFADKRIEEGEAQGGAGAVDEGDGITDFAELPKLPFIGNQGGRNAETDHVGKAVELFAERALAVGQPRHATVHAVEQHGEEYCNRCRLITPVHGLGDGEKGAEQRSDGKGVGQQVNTVLTQRIARRDWRLVLHVVHNRLMMQYKADGGIIPY